MHPRFVLAALAVVLLSLSSAPAAARRSGPRAQPHIITCDHLGCSDRRIGGIEPGNSRRALGRDAEGAGKRPDAARRAARVRETHGRPSLSESGGWRPNAAFMRVKRSRLVATINVKLARWVHRTGKCGFGQTEELATQYGRESRGRLACTGGRFYPGRPQAASISLPCGTSLLITNPHTGRSVAVTITDRGPATNATLDLSTGAARAIGMSSSSYVCVSRGSEVFASAGDGEQEAREPRRRRGRRRARR